MKKLLKYLGYLMLTALSAYSIWINTGKVSVDISLPADNIEIVATGNAAGPNVLGIQPMLT